MIISIDAEKISDKIQYFLMIKTLSILGIEGNVLTLIKAIYKKATANIILNGIRLNAFLLRWEIRQRCLLSPRLFNTVLEVLAKAIRQEKEIKSIHARREVKLSIHRWQNLAYRKKLKNPLKNS